MLRSCFIALAMIGSMSGVAAQSLSAELRKKSEDEIRSVLASSSSLNGLAAIDLTTGDGFFFNESSVFPQGSAIKIPVLMEVYKQAKEGKFQLSDRREIKSKELVGGTGILKDFDYPASLPIGNLAVLMITLSDNVATNNLIDLVGMQRINKTLSDLGMVATRIQRPMMDLAAAARGSENTSSPLEAVRILALLYNGKFSDEETALDVINVLKKNSRENSRLAAGIPVNVSMVFKTGVLPGVSTEWAIIYLPGRPYAVSAMQTYRVPGEEDLVLERVSKILYQYFWRIENASKLGNYIDRSVLRK